MDTDNYDVGWLDAAIIFVSALLFLSVYLIIFSVVIGANLGVTWNDVIDALVFASGTVIFVSAISWMPKKHSGRSFFAYGAAFGMVALIIVSSLNRYLLAYHGTDYGLWNVMTAIFGSAAVFSIGKGITNNEKNI